MDDKKEKRSGNAARQVFTVVERNGKSFWVRIGAAFGNYDGSETVLLDALPVNGRMQIRANSAKEAAIKAMTASGPTVGETGGTA